MVTDDTASSFAPVVAIPAVTSTTGEAGRPADDVNNPSRSTADAPELPAVTSMPRPVTDTSRVTVTGSSLADPFVAAVDDSKFVAPVVPVPNGDDSSVQSFVAAGGHPANTASDAAHRTPVNSYESTTSGDPFGAPTGNLAAVSAPVPTIRSPFASMIDTGNVSDADTVLNV